METRFTQQELDLSHQIIGLAMKVHTKLGPGLLESAYKECLFYELKKTGLAVEKEKPMPLIYEEVYLDCGYRIDLLVENKIVIEIKALDQFHPVHLAQTLTYMKLGEYRLGLMFNFKVARLKDGLKRVILADRTASAA
jgi:GxxExxY protein